MIQIPEATLITTIVLTAFLGGMIGYAVGLWHTKKIMLGNLKSFMEEEKFKPE
jgi:membrane protein DedA with SNARE-associated domain